MEIGIFYKNLLSALINGEAENIEDGVKKLKEIGISYYEVDAADIDTDRKEKALLDALGKNGVSVGSLYFKKEIVSDDSFAIDELLQYTRERIEQCKRIGCRQLMPVISLASNQQTADDALRDYYDTASRLSDAEGIHMVFENNTNSNTKCLTLDDIRKQLENSAKLGYLLDTGNFFFSKENVVSAVSRYKDKITGIHLKDVLPSERNQPETQRPEVHYTTLGKGVSEIKKAMEHLKWAGYEKGFTIELEKCNPMLPRIMDSVQFIKRCQNNILFALTAMEYHERLFEYAKAYEPLGEEVEMKTVHMNAVANIMNMIAEKMNLDERMQNLAVITGLFHDIGRYEQFKRYRTYYDSRSIDHGNLSAEILEQEGFIKDLPLKDQTMVLAAIRNHNKLAIEEGLDEETLLLAKMIRDADKIDIFRVVDSESFEVSYDTSVEELENDQISDIVYNSILQHKMALNKDKKTALDQIVGCLSFVYDLNFPVSKQIVLKNKNYFCKLDTLTYKNPQTKERIQIIFKEIEKYLNE